MKITKQQKTLLGAAFIGVAAYLIWQKTQTKKMAIGINRGRLIPYRPNTRLIDINEILSSKNIKRYPQTPQQSVGCGGVLYTQGRRVSIYCDSVSSSGSCVGDKWGCDRFNNRYNMSVLQQNNCENGC